MTRVITPNGRSVRDIDQPNRAWVLWAVVTLMTVAACVAVVYLAPLPGISK